MPPLAGSCTPITLTFIVSPPLPLRVVEPPILRFWLVVPPLAVVVALAPVAGGVEGGLMAVEGRVPGTTVIVCVCAAQPVPASRTPARSATRRSWRGRGPRDATCLIPLRPSIDQPLTGRHPAARMRARLLAQRDSEAWAGQHHIADGLDSPQEAPPVFWECGRWRRCASAGNVRTAPWHPDTGRMCGRRTGGRIPPRTEGFRRGEGGIRRGEGGIRSGEGGIRSGEGGIRTLEGAFSPLLA